MAHMKEATKVRPVTLTFAESAPPPATELLLRVALAAIQILERPLQAAQTAQDVNQLLRGGISQIFDGDQLFELAMNPAWVISADRRNQIRQTLLDEQESVSKNRDQSKQMAEDRRAVQKAVNVLQSKLLKGFVNPKDNTPLYGDEKNERIGGVRELGQRCVVRLANNEVFAGTLFLTNFRLVFISFNRTETEVTPGAQPSREAMQRHFTISVPLMGILKTGVKKTLRLASGLDWVAPILKVTCKDARRFHFLFDDNLLTLLNIMNDNSPEEPDKIGERTEQQNVCRRHVHTQSLREPKNAIMKMFGGSSGGGPGEAQSPKEIVAHSFHRQLETIRQQNLRRGSFMFERQESDGQWNSKEECWAWSEHWYDAPKEFERQGATAHDSPWRRTELNENFAFAPTYPKCLLVPRTFMDAQLIEVAKFRSKQRLPVLSWYDKETDAAIVRCAQPLVGMSGRKSAADAELFDHMTRANSNGKPLLLTDARAWAAAFANKGRKGGYEDVSHYEGAAATKPELVFLNIDNIHVMRSSISKMHSLVCSNKRANNAPVRRSEIIAADWLTHMGRILGGCRVIVEATWARRSSVVHCSDGWDRTAQLCAGSEICLDPYYRTFEGFRVLLQREWHAFGHKVRDRTWGQLKPDGSIKADEISPVLLQYLDYCHQLMYAHPKCFEFNEWFLISLLDCLHKGCSNFQVNTEKDYWERRDRGATVEYWSFMDGEQRQQYTNPKYDSEYSHSCQMKGPPGITPKVGSIVPPRVARVWEAYFNRFVASPVDGAPWWSVDGLPLWSRENEQKDIEERKARGLPTDGHRVDGARAAVRQPTVDGEAASGDGAAGGDRGNLTAHTLEKIAGQAGVVSSCRPQIVEPVVKFEGWLWLSTYSGEQRRWVSFYPTVEGEANLVHFELEEGSQSLVPKGVITLPSLQAGFLYTVQGDVESDRVDRFRFNIIVYPSLDQRDGTTHSFAAETDDDHMMWVETFRQATRSLGLTNVDRLRDPAQSAAGGRAAGRVTVRQSQPMSVAAAVASPRNALASAMGGGSMTPRSTPVIQHNEDGTVGLTLHKGQMGFGVNVSELSVVLDTRSNAEEAGVRKGQLIVAINDVPTPTKQAVHTVLKSSADQAKFTVREPSMIESRPRRKEVVNIKMKKEWKTHFVFTISQSYLFVQASFHSGPDLVASQPVMSRKSLGQEANEKEGGTLSQAFVVSHHGLKPNTRH
eukprot:COSAG02_NODE_2047_length_10013_cov_3.500403_3_plen_1212_part_00